MNIVEEAKMSIVEEDIDLYTAGKENALRRLRSCHPNHESYWKALASKYNNIVCELVELNAMFQTSPYKEIEEN